MGCNACLIYFLFNVKLCQDNRCTKRILFILVKFIRIGWCIWIIGVCFYLKSSMFPKNHTFVVCQSVVGYVCMHWWMTLWCWFYLVLASRIHTFKLPSLEFFCYMWLFCTLISSFESSYLFLFNWPWLLWVWVFNDVYFLDNFLGPHSPCLTSLVLQRYISIFWV